MVPGAQEESGFQGTVLSCVCSVFSCLHVYDGASPRLLQEDLLVPVAQEESGFQGAVLFLFCSRAFEGAPSRLLQEDLVVLGAQE